MNREITEADLREVAIAGFDGSPQVQIQIDGWTCKSSPMKGLALWEESRDKASVTIIHINTPRQQSINIYVPYGRLLFCHLKAIQKAAALGLVTLEATESEAKDVSI